MTLQQTPNTLTIKAKVGEEIAWRRDITKGWIRKKVISAFLITNYRIISPDGQMLWYPEIDDAIAVNTRNERVGNFQMYGGGRSFRYTMGQHRATYISSADIHFLSSVKHDIIWYGVEDCEGLIKLVKSLKKQDAFGKQMKRQEQKKHAMKDKDKEQWK